MQLKRGRFAFALDTNLECDPFLLRYANEVTRTVEAFGAELIHVTGPGDVGILGAYVAWRLRLPLAISWHTSLHEYAERRVLRLLDGCGRRFSSFAARVAKWFSMGILRWFYRRGRILFAPNQEICDWLHGETGRPVFPMSRGVDAELFTPARRTRFGGPFRIGYAGRLTSEKNVRFLADCGRSLMAAGHNHFQIEFIGQGWDADWLAANVPNAVMRGVLLGEELATAYADMDLFAFPSRTDTFGNVVLEALSSGVPALVTSGGGPKHIVQHGKTGFVAESDEEFTGYVQYAFENRQPLGQMGSDARSYAKRQDWDTVFGQVITAYENCPKQSREPSNSELRRDPVLLRRSAP